MTIDLKEIGPTYYFAPPRVFEGLLTSGDDPHGGCRPFKRKLFHHFMAWRRVGPALMDGKPWGARDRLPTRWATLVYGPLRNLGL